MQTSNASRLICEEGNVGNRVKNRVGNKRRKITEPYNIGTKAFARSFVFNTDALDYHSLLYSGMPSCMTE